MKQPTIITKILESYQRHSDSKPRFTPDELYIGQIAMLHKVSYKQDNNARFKRHNRTTPIKKYAIF
jgi:hypothetical protein